MIANIAFRFCLSPFRHQHFWQRFSLCRSLRPFSVPFSVLLPVLFVTSLYILDFCRLCAAFRAVLCGVLALYAVLYIVLRRLFALLPILCALLYTILRSALCTAPHSTLCVALYGVLRFVLCSFLRLHFHTHDNENIFRFRVGAVNFLFSKKYLDFLLTFFDSPVIMKYRKERVFPPFSGSFA